MSDRWVSVTDVAEHLGVARDTVYRWIESKGVPDGSQLEVQDR